MMKKKKLRREMLPILAASMIGSVIVATAVLVWQLGDLGWMIGAGIAITDWFVYRFISRQVEDTDPYNSNS